MGAGMRYAEYVREFFDCWWESTLVYGMTLIIRNVRELPAPAESG